MPKSKHRKNHKKKVQSRKNKRENELRSLGNQYKKLIEEQQRQADLQAELNMEKIKADTKNKPKILDINENPFDEEFTNPLEGLSDNPFKVGDEIKGNV